MTDENTMLIAIADGFVETDDGELHEITMGKSRIAREVLGREPQYLDFFEPGVAVRSATGQRFEVRERLGDLTIAR
jgi:hypothetical protein